MNSTSCGNTEKQHLDMSLKRIQCLSVCEAARTMQQLQATRINFLFCKITEVTVLTGVVEECSDTSETQRRGLKMKVEQRIHQLEEFVAKRTENQQPWREHLVMPDYTAQVICHTHLHQVYGNFS